MTTTVLAIAASKGGCAKTVTSLALAARLARDGHPTILIDVDPQGHSTLGLGIDVGPFGYIVSDLFDPRRPQSLERVLRPTSVPNLRLVASDPAVQQESSRIDGRARTTLRDAIQALTPAPSFVVIDCPPALGPLTENALVAADWLVVPCLMEARAPQGVDDVLRVRTALGKQDLIHGDWRVLYTRYDGRKRTMNARMDGVLSEAYAGRLLRTVIPQSEPLNQAQSAGVDIFDFAPTSTGAIQYAALAAELTALTGGAAC